MSVTFGGFRAQAVVLLNQLRLLQIGKGTVPSRVLNSLVSQPPGVFRP